MHHLTCIVAECGLYDLLRSYRLHLINLLRARYVFQQFVLVYWNHISLRILTQQA